MYVEVVIQQNLRNCLVFESSLKERVERVFDYIAKSICCLTFDAMQCNESCEPWDAGTLG